jgi:IclR family transcriptional regulator, acetate operon repressor
MVATSPTERVCALELRSARAIAFSAGDGYSVRMDRGASGKVILAFSSEDRLLRALALVDSDARASFRRQLIDVRRTGTAVTYGEIHPGAASVAAPIVDGSGEAVASICVFSPESRMQGKSLTTTKRLVRVASQQVSEQLKKGRGPGR